MKSENRVHFWWLFVVSSLWLGYCNPASAESDQNFPFTIEESKFLLNGEEVFLNIICYSPIEPGEDYDGKISEERMSDDLRRWGTYAYQEGSDPIVLRVYPQPTAAEPNRIPKFFYEEVRKLGFWIIRDIYSDQNLCDPNFIENGCHKVEAVIKEVSDANALDLIFAWEIGNEFLPDPKHTPCWCADKIEELVEAMCEYLKDKLDDPNFAGVSNWVTWGSYPPYDPLRTDTSGIPIEPNNLDYISYNAYSYWPDHIRDHQPGPVTGTPYQGYLAALKDRYPNKPLVISETGFSDSSQTANQERYHTWYPSYRYGGMTTEQVAEGLVERYWDARLLRDESDANIVIAGTAVFEWNDEWQKLGNPNNQSDYTEEHFGLGRFKEKIGEEVYQLRYKLQQEGVRDLYTLKFDNDVNIIDALVADANTLPVDGNTWVHTVISDAAAKPVRLRWETNRGYIIGDPNATCDLNNRLSEPNSVKFYAGGRWLGPATITVTAIDANRNVDTASTCINIETSEPNRIEILTVGPGLETGKASGCVYIVNLDKYKLVCYLLLNWTDELWAKPYFDMKSIWVDKEGYWWTPVQRHPDEDLFCWLVPVNSDPPDKVTFPPEPNWPPGHIAEANTVGMNPNDYNDVDNDLLLDKWEREHFTNINKYDRYDDPDGDMGNNLEEFLRGLDPNDANDDDNDGLWDNWERHFFGCIEFYDANDGPDGDGFNNRKELNKGLNPLRVAADKDEDRLSDLWEMRHFTNLFQNSADNPDFDGCTNLDEYEIGLDPLLRELAGDFDCDCDVDLYDLDLFVKQWLWPRFSADIAPDPNDRMVDFMDWAVFAKAWQSTKSSQNWNQMCDVAPDVGDGKVDWNDLFVFMEYWLQFYYGDIVPDEGDDMVNFLDFAAFAENWLGEL